ncbi:MAG: outer membrane protein assembly factor BamD [Verrucomicrobiota bacterium]
MKFPRHIFSQLTLLCVVGVSFSSVQSAQGVLGLLDRKGKKDISEGLSQQEIEARELSERGDSLYQEQKYGKSRDVYEKVVQSYPMTNAAAHSQFQLGQSYENEGELLEAFNAYQIYIDKYNQGEQFTEALGRQFDIAMRSTSGRTAKLFRVVPVKTQASRQVEMFQNIATSAPYSSFAPKALYQVGIIEYEADHVPQALRALQDVIDNYPSDPMAKEASVKMIEIRSSQKTRDDSQIERTQIEMERFLYDFGDDPRASGIREQVTEINNRNAEKDFKIGSYYEKQKRYRAAAIYYQQIQKGSSHYEKAQDRLTALAQIDPNLIQSPAAPKKRVLSDVAVTTKPDYVGPPAPKTAARPKMRVSEEEFKPIPVQ